MFKGSGGEELVQCMECEWEAELDEAQIKEEVTETVATETGQQIGLNKAVETIEVTVQTHEEDITVETASLVRDRLVTLADAVDTHMGWGRMYLGYWVVGARCAKERIAARSVCTS